MDRIDSGVNNDVVVQFAKKMVETIEGKTVKDWFKPHRIDAQKQIKIEVLKTIWDSELVNEEKEDALTLDIMNLAREHLKE